MDIVKDKIKAKECVGRLRKELKLEQTYVIPDIKSDIIKMISSTGNIFIEKVELQNKRVKIDGNANVYNLYLDSEECNSFLDVRNAIFRNYRIRF